MSEKPVLLPALSGKQRKSTRKEVVATYSSLEPNNWLCNRKMFLLDCFDVLYYLRSAVQLIVMSPASVMV